MEEQRSTFDQEHWHEIPGQGYVNWGPIGQFPDQATFAHRQEQETGQGYEPVQQHATGTGQAAAWSNNWQEYGHAFEQQQGYALHNESQQEYFHLPNTTLAPTIKPNVAKRMTSLVYRIWAWEVAASLFSIACVASVAGILAYEEGKPLDQWQQGIGRNISPTAVVSFLGTLGKSACLLAVAEVISQLKWIHFRSRDRKMADLQAFDDASRGPWGALLLASTKARTALLATFASALVIAALFVDPFIQLVFSFPSRLTPMTGTTASIVASQVYDPFSLDERYEQCYGASQVDSIMQAAILAPVWNATRSPDLPCNFERCEWPTITTLGVCSSCFDLSDTVVPDCVVFGRNKDQIQCNYTLPTAKQTFVTLFAVTGGAAERAAYQPLWSSSVQMFDSDGLYLYNPTVSKTPRINQFSFISFEAGMPWQSYIDYSDLNSPALKSFPSVKQAMQCTFDLCARTFTEPSYANSTASPLTGPQTPLLVTTVPLESSSRVLVDLAPSTSDHPPMNTTFQVNFCDYTVLAEYLGGLFTTQYNSTGMTSTLSQSITPNIGLSLSKVDDIPALMQGIADSMTEAFKTSANSTTYDGAGLNTVTYISITWAWLALPIALVLFTFVILVVVILRNNARGIPAWKSSSLALLFHNLEGWDRYELQVNGPDDLRRRVANMTGRVSGEGGVPLFSRARP